MVIRLVETGADDSDVSHDERTVGPRDTVALVREVARGRATPWPSCMTVTPTAIFASAYRLTSDRGLAEEVVQETFLGALEPRRDIRSVDRVTRRRGCIRSRATGPSIAFGGRPASDARAVVVGRLRGAARRCRRGPGCGCTRPRARQRRDRGRLGPPHRGRPRWRSRSAGGARPPARLAAMPEEERVVIVLAYGEDPVADGRSRSGSAGRSGRSRHGPGGRFPRLREVLCVGRRPGVHQDPASGPDGGPDR